MYRIHDIQYANKDVPKCKYVLLLLHPQSLAHTSLLNYSSYPIGNTKMTK